MNARALATLVLFLACGGVYAASTVFAPFGSADATSSSSGGGFDGGSVYFSATQTDAGGAVMTPQGSRTCFDGTTCTKYLSSDGTNLTLTSLNHSATKFIATATSGNQSVNITQGGRLTWDGTTGSKYLNSDGTNLVLIGLTGWVNGNGQGVTYSGNTTQLLAANNSSSVLIFGGATQYASFQNGRTDFPGQVRPVRSTLGTCNSSNEGAIAADVAAGSTLGARTKICACTSDGAGSPAYAWQNLATAAVGTSTTCG